MVLNSSRACQQALQLYMQTLHEVEDAMSARGQSCGRRGQTPNQAHGGEQPRATVWYKYSDAHPGMLLSISHRENEVSNFQIRAHDVSSVKANEKQKLAAILVFTRMRKWSILANAYWFESILFNDARS